MYIWTYGIRKTWLDKCRKSPASEDSFSSNVVNGSNNRSKLNDSTSLRSQFRLKKLLWVISKFLGLSVSPLTADNQYSVLNRGNLLQNFQMQLLQKRKIFSEFFFIFPQFIFNFEHLQEKDESHSYVILNLRLRKMWLRKCQKSRLSEDPLTSNIVNRLKNCSKLNDSTFTIFIDPFKINACWKSCSEWHTKY